MQTVRSASAARTLRNTNATSPMPNQYPKPRLNRFRFDMVTLFAATTLWAILLAGMRMLNFPLRGYAVISILLLGVGVGLFVFRRFGRPLSVSMTCGVVLTILGTLILQVVQGRPIHLEFGLVVYGAAYGFFAFFFFVSILICAELVRSVLSRLG